MFSTDTLYGKNIESVSALPILNNSVVLVATRVFVIADGEKKE